MFRQRTRITAVLTIIILIGIGWYIYFEARGLLTGPIITVTEPHNGSLIHTPSFMLIGETERVAHLSLNGRQIFTDIDGVFNEKVLLLPGYNILHIEARDRFERTTLQTLELIYEEQPDFLTPTSTATTSTSTETLPSNQ